MYNKQDKKEEKQDTFLQAINVVLISHSEQQPNRHSNTL